jgi:hypothetical protein
MPSFRQLAGKLLAITDDIFDRAAMGFLDEYTGPNGVTSPAQVGFRAIDQDGNAIFDSMGLIAVMSTLVNGGTQTGGPIIGVAGPPTGLSGFGGERILATGIFTLARQATVMILALCSNYVQDAGVHVGAHPIYFRIDGVSEADTAYGFVPVFTTGDAETRTHSSTILKVVELAVGNHTIDVIWNSQEGASDTIFNANNPLFVFRMGF